MSVYVTPDKIFMYTWIHSQRRNGSHSYGLESHIDKLIGDRDPKSFLPDASILTFERK